MDQFVKGYRIDDLFFCTNTSLSFAAGNMAVFIKKFLLDYFPKDFFRHIHVSNKRSTASRQDYNNKLKEMYDKKRNPMLLFRYGMTYNYDHPFLHSQYTSQNENYYNFADTSDKFTLLKDIDKIDIKYKFDFMKIECRATLIVDTEYQLNDVYSLLRSKINEGRVKMPERRCQMIIPNIIISKIANTVDMEVTSQEFIEYLNKHSEYPIELNLNKGSGNANFIMTYEDESLIRFENLDVDDNGEKIGYEKSDFKITLPISATFKYPDIFYFLNYTRINSINLEKEEVAMPKFTTQDTELDSVPLTTIQKVLASVPKEINDHHIHDNLAFNIDIDSLNVDGYDETNISFKIPERIREYIMEVDKDKLEDIIKLKVFKDEDELTVEDDYEFEIDTCILLTKNIDDSATYRVFIYINKMVYNNYLKDKK